VSRPRLGLPRRTVLLGCSCCLFLGTTASAQVASVTETRPVESAPGVLRPVQPLQPESAPSPGFGDVFKQSFKDLGGLTSTESLTWLGIGASAAVIAHAWDPMVTDSLSATAVLEEPLEPGEVVGGALVQFGAALATFTIGKVADKPSVTAVGADLVRAQVVSQAVTQTVKLAVRRTRPDGTSLSFPSGHASTSFATATVLQRHFGWKAGIPAYALASYVAANRIQSERHYLSDVLFGAAVGIMAGRTVTVGLGDHRFAVVPLATPGGAGVSFVHLER